MENKVDPQLLMNDQMKAVLQKSAELAGDAFVTDVGFAEMRENYVRERRFWNEGGPVMAKTVERTFEGPMGEFMARYYYPVEASRDRVHSRRRFCCGQPRHPRSRVPHSR